MKLRAEHARCCHLGVLKLEVRREGKPRTLHAGDCQPISMPWKILIPESDVLYKWNSCSIQHDLKVVTEPIKGPFPSQFRNSEYSYIFSAEMIFIPNEVVVAQKVEQVGHQLRGRCIDVQSACQSILRRNIEA